MEEMPAGERLGFDIKRAEQALMSAKAAALRETGLSVAQYAALFALHDSPGISGAALARVCLVTPQAMAAVLKALAADGLVERGAHPWYQHVLQTRITEAGTERLRAADRRAAPIERRMADALTPEERDTLRELLDRCVTAVNADGSP
ncbi:MarR family transcriptional regulator [Nocardiopsis sp. EMB25]|uniref:MarR family winged helix-turn-helix transcriptional regulator n=1 Tax=Nocardiopsis sp. EMB25 TaxID=2835867 RepID=UPI002284A324|nr:MarR family transcriptional regulator [Nocardiopsis sp. EMB25]MCY9786754.1 MarR family transcriptional regulator [Nocardiopsis sp. EMB25]